VLAPAARDPAIGPHARMGDDAAHAACPGAAPFERLRASNGIIHQSESPAYRRARTPFSFREPCRDELGTCSVTAPVRRSKSDSGGNASNLHTDPRYGPDLAAVEEYVQLGGKLHWCDLSPELLESVLGQGTPLLTGTNGTYLYQCARETEAGEDDVAGESFGHFIVLCGYRGSDQTVSIADPLKDNPAHGTKYYRAGVYRLIGAIFLGIGSDDGNLLRIQPRYWKERLAIGKP
jgi:hypothetical protein